METKVHKQLEVSLTDPEVAAYAESLAIEVKNNLDVKAEAKAAAKEFKGRLDMIDIDVKNFAERVRSKKEYRSVECEWKVDFDRNTKTLVRLDTMREVETRVLTAEERQLVLEGMEAAEGEKSMFEPGSSEGKAETA